MPDLSSAIASDIAWYYEFIAAHFHKWVDPLTQGQFWHNYIGARVAETGYVRDRDREFTEAGKLDKAKVLEAFDQAIAMVVSTARKQKPENWLAPYSAELEPEAAERFMIFLRCAGHAYHHVGQIIFLSKELTKAPEPRSASV
jgi:hypothetical protein